MLSIFKMRQRIQMNDELSIYLDLIIITFWGCSLTWVPITLLTPRLFWLPNSGRDAVAFFFLLSGFVISTTGHDRNKRPLTISPPRPVEYALSYFSFCQYEKLHIYIPFHLLFGDEIWMLTEKAFSIGACWSLSHKVWYYVPFGLSIYLIIGFAFSAYSIL